MKLHTVFVTYNRLELTKIALDSYLETVTGWHSYVVVDNGSTDGTQTWLIEEDHPAIFFPENRFPGPAANAGWAMAQDPVDVLHRADNDFRFLPGWVDELARVFADPSVGQVGLRTDEEECNAPMNVGGNCAIRRSLWDAGLRYDERPWGHPDIPKGWTEDSLLSPAVRAMGFQWTRVERPCIVPTSVEDPSDPYYQRTWELRGITPPRKTRRGGQAVQ